MPVAPTYSAVLHDARAGTLTVARLIAFMDTTDLADPLVGRLEVTKLVGELFPTIKTKQPDLWSKIHYDTDAEAIGITGPDGDHVYAIGGVITPGIKARIGELWQHTGAPVVGGVVTVAQFLAKLGAVIFSAEFWIRAAEVTVGVLLVGVGAAAMSHKAGAALGKIPVYGKVIP